MHDQEIFSRLLLAFANGIGPKTAAALLQAFGTAENIQKASLKELLEINGMSKAKVQSLKCEEHNKLAQAEIDFALKHNIAVLHSGMEEFPYRLKECADAPQILFYKGNATLNAKKIIAIVGTRNLSDYGQRMTEDLVQRLSSEENLLIVSGLAQGIDAVTHKMCVKHNIPTVGVLGHGLDRIYPYEHKQLAKEMAANGGLLTEYTAGTKPDRNHFPMRNRIVAGMSDVVVVAESGIKGGAMITAWLAAGYHREIAAFPGRAIDQKSSGCNELIKRNAGALIESGDDLLKLMNWQSNKSKPVPKQLSIILSQEAQEIWNLLQSGATLHIDEMSVKINLPYSLLSATLLEMEMDGLIKSLPGKQYRIV